MVSATSDTPFPPTMTSSAAETAPSALAVRRPEAKEAGGEAAHFCGMSKYIKSVVFGGLDGAL